MVLKNAAIEFNVDVGVNVDIGLIVVDGGIGVVLKAPATQIVREYTCDPGRAVTSQSSIARLVLMSVQCYLAGLFWVQ